MNKFARGGLLIPNTRGFIHDQEEFIAPHEIRIEGIEDIVRVVRCKECKYRYTAKSGLILCTQHITMTPKNYDFCSYGERKDENK